MAPRNIDRRRAELLARRDEILRMQTGCPMSAADRTAFDEIDDELNHLDEAANRGDDRPYPRVKIRKVPDTVVEVELPADRRWLITQVDAPELDEERILGAALDLPTAHGMAVGFVKVQQHLARMIGGAL